MAIPLHAILKAAVALRQFTVEQLSVETAIRESRSRSILAGRLVPTAGEVKRILLACGSKASYGTPRSILGGHRSVDDALWGLLVERSEPQSGVGSLHGTLLIDKVSITFDVGTARRLLRLLRRRAKRCFPRRAHYPTSYSFHGVLVQHGFRDNYDQSKQQHRRRTSRLEFNPAKLDSSQRSFVRAVLRLANRSSIRLSKIDVAVDFAVDHVVQAIGSSRKHARLFIGGGGIETHYIGAPGSEVQLRIYDKARLQKKRRAEALARGRAVSAPITGPLTRFEAAHSNVKTPLSRLADLPNPFRDLRLVVLAPRDLPLGLRLTIQFARAFGLQAIRAFTDSAEYKRIVAEIEQHVRRPEFHPTDVFDLRWSDVVADFLRLISTRERKRRAR